VHVPVEHRDAVRQALGEGRLHRDGDVVQQAEAVGEIRQAMVPRRAAQGIGVFDLAPRVAKKAALASPAERQAMS
jgi:hypothetical protein